MRERERERERKREKERTKAKREGKRNRKSICMMRMLKRNAPVKRRRKGNDRKRSFHILSLAGSGVN